MFEPRPTKSSKRARVRRNIVEAAHQYLLDNGIAVEDVWRVESCGESASGQEEILFSCPEGKARTAMLAGSIEKQDARIVVVEGWS